MPVPDWWHELSPLLDEALELSRDDRAAWMSKLRARDQALADRIESLLDTHRELDDNRFLEQSVGELQLRSTLEGRRIGPYVIVSLLGEGGMGSVWFAERADGELKQSVAIKLLGVAGGVRRGWRERFLRERQLLAALDHPSIVRLLDAGRTEDGLPYLVMEHVSGQPIDAYAAGIPIAGRLRLFLQVCEAVAYAHRRLVVHRDLKPSNILVDDSGQPKLLDFGIAKLLDDTAQRTVTVERVLTPSYASPEQLRGEAQATSTDIYSLGAVLYKLLTGRSPNDTHSGSDDGSRERLALRAEHEASIERIPPATRLNPALPADVDYVLRRALRYEPEKRYGSVEALASDVRAVLDARPVEARSGDRWYRGRKFLSRHWLPIAAAGLVFLSLGVGLYTTARQRTIADRRFNQVRRLANEFIELDAEIRNLPGSTSARQQIVTESLTYLAGLDAEAHGDRALTLDLANAYLRIARVQGVPASVGNLGQLPQAETSLQKADALIRALAANERDRRALLLSAEIDHDWMAVDDYQDRRIEALSHARRAAAELDRFLSLDKPTPEEIDDATHLYSNIANSFHNGGQFDTAIVFVRRALDISKGVDAARMHRAAALGKLSEALVPGGNLDEAFEAIRESRDILERSAPSGAVSARINLINALTREGSLTGEDPNGTVNAGVSLNRPAEALVEFERAMDMAETLADSDPQDYRSRRLVANASVEIGAILRHSDPERALAVYDHALARLREVPANARIKRDAIDLMAGSSYPLRAMGRQVDATKRIDEAFRLLRETKQYPTDRIEPGRDEPYVVLRAQAADADETGQPQRAVEVYEQLLGKMMAWKPTPETSLLDATPLSNVWQAYAAALRRVGRGDDARTIDDRRAHLWKTWYEKQPQNQFVRRQFEAVNVPALTSKSTSSQ